MIELTTEKLAAEKDFLDKAHSTYTVHYSSQTRAMREWALTIFEPFLWHGEGLELGCSDGFMTEGLSRKISHLEVVDGSQKFLNEARLRKLPNVSFNYSLFEEYSTAKQYDFVFASYVLEHVLDTEAIYKMIRRVLKPKGLLFTVVPNARALSRQLALQMNLITDLYSLTQNDIQHGHRRVFDSVSLNQDLEKGGFSAISQGGIIVKILADFQMDKLIDDNTLKKEHLEGLFRLGKQYPELCGSIYSICQLKN